MSDSTSESFFEKHSRFGRQAPRRSKLVAWGLAGFVFATTAILCYGTAEGAFVKRLPSTDQASEEQRRVIRHHGWGGYYVFIGRSHFGGGGSIH